MGEVAQGLQGWTMLAVELEVSELERARICLHPQWVGVL